MVSKEQFHLCMPAATSERLDMFCMPLNDAMEKFRINTFTRRAAFFGQIAVESAQLKYTRENLNYSAKGLLKVFPRYFTQDNVSEFAYKPEKIANHVYANRGGNGDESSGDGWRYRGAGLIQTTLKDNFISTGNGIGADLVNHPELLEKPVYAAESAAWYFMAHGCNELADLGDFRTLTKRINSALLAFDDRMMFFELAKTALKP
jgi:putative chitinase